MNRRTFLSVVAAQVFLGACAGSRTKGSAAPTPTSTTEPPRSEASTTSTTIALATTTTVGTPAPEVPGGIVRRIDSPKSPIFLQYDAGIPEEWLSLVADTLPLGQTDLGDSGLLLYHTYSTPDLFVPVYAKAVRMTEDAVRSALATTRSMGLAGNIYQYYPNVNGGPGAPYPRVSLLHEYFHTVQNFLSNRALTPAWLAEGSADYFSFRIGTERGLAPAGSAGNLDVNRRNRRSSAGRRAAALGTFESRPPAPDSYTLGFLATDYLVETYGITKAVQDVWVAMKTQRDWKLAFADTYGIPVDQFYADFEAIRKTF